MRALREVDGGPVAALPVASASGWSPENRTGRGGSGSAAIRWGSEAGSGCGCHTEQLRLLGCNRLFNRQARREVDPVTALRTPREVDLADWIALWFFKWCWRHGRW